MKICLVLILTMLSSLVHAEQTYNCQPSEISQKFEDAVVVFLNVQLPFDWNQRSLKIVNTHDRPLTVNFNSNDGTPFALASGAGASCAEGDPNPDHCVTVYSITQILEGRRRTDVEGNYVGPVICRASTERLFVVNLRTKNYIDLKDEAHADIDLEWIQKK